TCSAAMPRRSSNRERSAPVPPSPPRPAARAPAARVAGGLLLAWRRQRARAIDDLRPRPAGGDRPLRPGRGLAALAQPAAGRARGRAGPRRHAARQRPGGAPPPPRPPGWPAHTPPPARRARGPRPAGGPPAGSAALPAPAVLPPHATCSDITRRAAVRALTLFD